MPADGPRLSHTFLSSVVAELSAVGMHHVAKLDESLCSLAVRVDDAGGRPHTLTIALTPAYPSVPPRCFSDLPADMPPVLSIADAVRTYRECIHSLEPYWAELDDLDRRAVVVDKATSMRRIAIAQHCTAMLKISHAEPRSFPLHLSFLGPDRLVQDLNARVAAHRQDWCTSRSIVDNLEMLLDVQIAVGQDEPTPTNIKPDASAAAAKAQSAFECGICLAYHLGGSGALAGGDAESTDASEDDPDNVPSFHCPNTQCGQAFHKACITEWLRSVPDTRQSLYLLLGPCPFCETPLPIESAAMHGAGSTMKRM
ncbi:FANCL C-terminal domain-containing protein [Entophlyctis helioformis]|nr:FANCL C-terminal domain-containing protein [Entophlyctis helioformis]